jgi:SAM-dependent methyltransferase
MTAAARAGFEGLATDYYEDALLFAQVNVWRNAGALVAVRHVDWRDFPVDLGTFDLVVASDVLYERSYAPLLAYAYARTLAPGGRGVVADPGRVGRDAFLGECGGRGLTVRTMTEVPFAAGEIRQTITLLEIVRR